MVLLYCPLFFVWLTYLFVVGVVFVNQWINIVYYVIKIIQIYNQIKIKIKIHGVTSKIESKLPTFGDFRLCQCRHPFSIRLHSHYTPLYLFVCLLKLLISTCNMKRYLNIAKQVAKEKIGTKDASVNSEEVEFEREVRCVKLLFSPLLIFWFISFAP